MWGQKRANEQPESTSTTFVTETKKFKKQPINKEKILKILVGVGLTQ